jgi:multidrug efflux pump subunit AcrB
MMHGHEKSRSAIVAVKPTNKAERSAAESVERRAETKGNVDQQRTRRTQRRISVSQMLARIRQHIVAVDTQGGNRMRESCTYGSVRGVRGNSHPYRAGSLLRCLRTRLGRFPEVTFSFQAADMVTQILNFGLPAPIDVRTVGRDRATNLRVAQELRRRIAAIPGIVDAHLQQAIDGPAFMAAIDRARALQFGLNARSIANDINISLTKSPPQVLRCRDC